MNGDEAEKYAEEFLQRQGLILLERNYRCRFGEIDLIVRDGAVLVFIEVRMRASQVFGGAAKLIAEHFIARLLDHIPFPGFAELDQLCRVLVDLFEVGQGNPFQNVLGAFQLGLHDLIELDCHLAVGVVVPAHRTDVAQLRGEVGTASFCALGYAEAYSRNYGGSNDCPSSSSPHARARNETMSTRASRYPTRA